MEEVHQAKPREAAKAANPPKAKKKSTEKEHKPAAEPVEVWNLLPRLKLKSDTDNHIAC